MMAIISRVATTLGDDLPNYPADVCSALITIIGNMIILAFPEEEKRKEALRVHVKILSELVMADSKTGGPDDKE
jgi:hypothetical protein